MKTTREKFRARRAERIKRKHYGSMQWSNHEQKKFQMLNAKPLKFNKMPSLISFTYHK
jgi:hypothetical protein